MNVDIYEDNIDPLLWDEVLSQSDIYDIYQTFEWQKLMKNCYNIFPTFLIFSNSDDIIGGQLFFRKKILNFIPSYEALGGPLCKLEDIKPIQKMVINNLLKEKKSFYVLMRPKIVENAQHFLNLGFRKSDFYTFILNIAKDEKNIWKNMNKKARTGIRKAEKSKVIIKSSDKWEEWLHFYKLHVSHSRSRKICPKTLNFFKEIYREFLPKGMAKLFTAFYEDSLIGGMLFLIYEDTITYYIGATDDRYQNYSSNDLLMWYAIQWGNKNRITYLDLGDTFPDKLSHLYGIHKFKEKWGGQLVERDFYIHGTAYSLGRNLVLNNRIVQNVYERFHELNFI